MYSKRNIVLRDAFNETQFTSLSNLMSPLIDEKNNIFGENLGFIFEDIKITFHRELSLLYSTGDVIFSKVECEKSILKKKTRVIVVTRSFYIYLQRVTECTLLKHINRSEK